MLRGLTAISVKIGQGPGQMNTHLELVRLRLQEDTQEHLESGYNKLVLLLVIKKGSPENKKGRKQPK